MTAGDQSLAADRMDASAVLDTSAPLRLLVIEDSPTDAELLGELLADELPHGELDAVPSLGAPCAACLTSTTTSSWRT